MTKIGVAIKTADRGAVGSRNYIGATLANLRRAGAFGSEHLAGDIVLVDTGRGDAPDYIRRAVSGDPALDGAPLEIDSAGERSLHANAARAIQRAAATEGADYALVLEDDTDFCDDFLGSVARWLADHDDGLPNMFAFGANYRQIGAAWRRGETSWPYPCNSFYGAVACAWRREWALDVLDWYGPDPAYLNQDGSRIYDRGHDLMLGRWGRERHGLRHYVASAPCFVQHVGEESGLGNRVITYGSWCGPGWSYPRGNGGPQ